MRLGVQGVATAAEPPAGAQVVLEELDLLDALDPLDGLEQLGDLGGGQVRVERPAGAVAPPVSGLTYLSTTASTRWRTSATGRPGSARTSAATLTPW